MTIAHIYFDLDGTLIGSSGDVKPSVWEAIEPLRGRVGLSICTGRPRAGIARRVARQLDPHGLHIFENGGMVAPPDGEPLEVVHLDPNDLDVLVRASRTVAPTLELYTTQGVFVSRRTPDGEEHARAIEIPVEIADLGEIAARHEVIRAHWIARDHTLDEVLQLPLRAAEQGVASSPVLPGMVFVSVTRRGTTKGTAAARVADAVGTRLADSAAIGDAVGDLTILEAVGHPFVVANSAPELLARFEALGHVDEDGVERLLRELGPFRGVDSSR